MTKSKSDQEMGISLKSITKAVVRCTKAKQLYFATRTLASSGEADEGLMFAADALRENFRAEVRHLHEMVEALLTDIDNFLFDDEAEELALTLIDTDTEEDA